MKLCIVTDIFSKPTAKDCIVAKLPFVSEVARFALNELCDRPDLVGEPLHRHLFDHNGFDEGIFALRAVLGSGYFGLGYSAGGTLLWRAAAQGMPLNGIFCVSSTRLRNEAAISNPNHVFFGALDQNKPSSKWLSTIPEYHTVFQGVGHSYYLKTDSKEVKETNKKIANHIVKLSSENEKIHNSSG